MVMVRDQQQPVPCLRFSKDWGNTHYSIQGAKPKGAALADILTLHNPVKLGDVVESWLALPYCQELATAVGYPWEFGDITPTVPRITRHLN
jgi:hypothetical protein